MNPENPNPNPVQPGYKNPLSATQPGEKTICEIKRHPIGLLGMYGMTGIVLLGLGVLLLVVVPGFATSANRSSLMAISVVIFFVVAMLAGIVLLIAHTVYWGNRWIVTSDSITQITQTGLFQKHSAQVSLGDIEDISVRQDGIFPHMFKYGVIKAETANEHTKFEFTFCPNPNTYAQSIINAREVFEQSYHGGMQMPTAEENRQPVPQQYQPMPPEFQQQQTPPQPPVPTDPTNPQA
jgi:hypothetical protein